MVMDMLEFEVYTAGSSITSRSAQTLFTIQDGQDGELTKSFLLKKMEINFCAVPTDYANDATYAGGAPFYLTFGNFDVPDAVNTIAEQFDARFEDRIAHQGQIWDKIFWVRPHLIDDADNVAVAGSTTVMNTSKSFPKGFRLDKDEQYAWSIFNPTTATLDIVSSWALRVRFWGVYLE